MVLLQAVYGALFVALNFGAAGLDRWVEHFRGAFQEL